jgi:hypothetical protein
VPGWVITALLQPVVHAGRAPDGFNGLHDAGEVFAGALAGAVTGAVGLFVVASLRARPRPCRQEALAMGFYAVVLLPLAVIAGAILTVMTGPGGVPLVALLALPTALHFSWVIARATAQPGDEPPPRTS